MPNDIRERAAHPEIELTPDSTESYILSQGFRMPFITVQNGQWTVQFVSESGIGAYSGTGRTFEDAFKEALAAGPELVPSKETIDAAAEESNIV